MMFVRLVVIVFEPSISIPSDHCTISAYIAGYSPNEFQVKAWGGGGENVIKRGGGGGEIEFDSISPLYR